MTLTTHGTFSVESRFEPPFHADDGITLGRARFDKRFSGGLEATSFVEMLYARTPDPACATYVAIERITGTLCGHDGSFVVHHVGVRDGATDSLTLSIVPGSGTGALAGITGGMDITITDGVHHYAVSAALPA
jgi:hypothetical protein